jgi:hypothetical protein
MEVIGICTTRNFSSDPSSSGFAAYPAFSRFRFWNASLLTMSRPPEMRSAAWAFRAAGFIATRTAG